MNPKENHIITILFERVMVSTSQDMCIYAYFPLEVIEGKELSFDRGKVLQVNKVASVNDPDYMNEETRGFEFSNIEDPMNSIERFGYGFSIIVNGQSKEDIRSLKFEMLKTMKQVFQNPLFHIIDNASDFSKLFIKVGPLAYNISSESYYELDDALHYLELGDVPKAIADGKKEAKIAVPEIIIPKDIVYSDEIYDKVSQTVICQDEQIKIIASAIAKNSRLTSPSLKSNLLVCGPTGVGKSEIFRSIHERFDIPVAFEDSNEYTAASYKGKDVNEMLMHLIENAGGDVEKAQRGILIIDEIDKKVSHSGEHETFTSAVINSLLKMMEGHVYTFTVPGHGEFQFDTSQLTFAFLGAFSGIEEYSNKRRTMGFTTYEQEMEAKAIKNIYNDDTLHKYGLLPEFIGRCDTVVAMNALGIEDLIKIIKTSDKSQLLLYRDLFKNIGINFIYDEKTIEAIAKKAHDLQLGARSIKKIVENALAVVNYEIFARRDFKELIISPETIEDNKQFILR